MALLRYISRAAVKLDKAEITQKLLTYLPKEGGVLLKINCSPCQPWRSLRRHCIANCQPQKCNNAEQVAPSAGLGQAQPS